MAWVDAGGKWGGAASAAAPGAAGAEARGGPGGGCWTDALRGVVEEEIDRDCEELNLNYNELLRAAGAAALVPALQHAQCRLTELRLGNNVLRAAGAAALVPALEHPRCLLVRLDLGFNKLGAAGAAALVPALQHVQCRLTKLPVQRLTKRDGRVHISLCSGLTRQV